MIYTLYVRKVRIDFKEILHVISEKNRLKQGFYRKMIRQYSGIVWIDTFQSGSQ
jgi:hypothetical protein